jgi:hypothetical protein
VARKRRRTSPKRTRKSRQLQGVFYVEGRCPHGVREYKTSSDLKLVRKHATSLQKRRCAIVMGWKD